MAQHQQSRLLEELQAVGADQVADFERTLEGRIQWL